MMVITKIMMIIIIISKYLVPICSDLSLGFSQQAMFRSQNLNTNIMTSTADVQGVNNGIPLTRVLHPKISVFQHINIIATTCYSQAE